MSNLLLYSSRPVWLNISTIRTFSLISLSVCKNNMSVWLQKALADEEIWEKPRSCRKAESWR